jgi:hypothetical protein
MQVTQSAAGVSVLQWRRDVGESAYLEGLRELVG